MLKSQQHLFIKIYIHSIHEITNNLNKLNRKKLILITWYCGTDIKTIDEQTAQSITQNNFDVKSYSFENNNINYLNVHLIC